MKVYTQNNTEDALLAQFKKDNDLKLPLYPIKYNGVWLNKEDCGDMFVGVYHSRYSLVNNNHIYLGEQMYVSPLDEFLDEEVYD
jgi:hypothetical protein